MTQQHSEVTSSQKALLVHLEDVAEHVTAEFDQDEYDGVSTEGYAHISNVDGRFSFVKRVKSLARDDHPAVTTRARRNDHIIRVGSLSLRLAPNPGNEGYQLSITNISDFQPGPEGERLDVQEQLHNLVLKRLKYHGYLYGANVASRMD